MWLEPNILEDKEIIEKNTRFIKDDDFREIEGLSKELATEDFQVENIKVRGGYRLVKAHKYREQIPVGFLAKINRQKSDRDLVHTFDGAQLISSMKVFKRLGIKAEDGKVFLYWARVK